MTLNKGFQMCLTKMLPKPKLCCVNTIACEAVQGNEGNKKNARSPSRSPSNVLKYKNNMPSGERKNNFPVRAHGRIFLLLYILILFLNIIPFIFFTPSCARIFMFTRSLLKKINLKTNTYQVNQVKMSFQTRSLVHLKG